MFWLYSFHVNPLLSSSGLQRENSGSTSTTSTLSPSRLDNDINFSPNLSHRDTRDPVSVTRPNRWPTWHWHWWELETYIVKPESEVPKSKVPKSRQKGLGLTLKSHGPTPTSGSEWPPWLIQPKKFTRWTARSRTWVCPTCSRRGLSINPNF